MQATPGRERHRRAANLFVAAARLAPAERARFLDHECGDDADLRREVDSLLAHDPGDDDERFGDAPLPGVAALVDSVLAPVPARIGRYRIDGVLGRGGMGIVYRARQEVPARDVALKVMAPELGGRDVRARFAAEAEALGRLQHPGIAQIFESGTYASADGERPYLAMELVHGEPLQQWAARCAPSVAERVRLVVQIAEAVHHAHQKGLIHRDLKPGNVLVDQDGRTKVLDFGIARFVDDERNRTLTGQVLGTIAYMSPEQADGGVDRVDIRSDVYALGVIGYELLAGHLPIDVAGEGTARSLRRLCEEEPRPLGDHDPRLRGDLQTIFAMALRKEPERRYDSAQALAADLRRFLARQPIAARTATFGYVARRFAQRHAGLVAGALLALVAMTAGTVASVAWALQASRSESAAREEARIASRVTEMLRSLLTGANPEQAAGRDLSAKELLASGRAQLDRELAADDPALFRIALILGDVFVGLGDFAAAEAYLERGLEALRKEVTGDDPRLVEALHVRAWALLRQQRYAEAGELYEEALAMHRRLGTTSDVTTAKCLEGLAKVAARASQYDRARQYLDEALPLRERLGDPLRLSFHWQTVASTCLLAGRLDDADAAFARARALLPADGSEAYASTLAGNVGNLRLRQRRLADAETEFRTALALAEHCYESNSPRLVASLSQLGAICGQTGRLDESEALLQRAVAAGGDETKSTDRSLASALSNLAMVHATRGQVAEALPFWERAEAMEQRLRPGSKGHLDLLETIAGAKEALGDPAAAAALRTRAAALRHRD